MQHAELQHIASHHAISSRLKVALERRQERSRHLAKVPPQLPPSRARRHAAPAAGQPTTRASCKPSCNRTRRGLLLFLKCSSYTGNQAGIRPD